MPASSSHLDNELARELLVAMFKNRSFLNMTPKLSGLHLTQRGLVNAELTRERSTSLPVLQSSTNLRDLLISQLR